MRDEPGHAAFLGAARASASTVAASLGPRAEVHGEELEELGAIVPRALQVAFRATGLAAPPLSPPIVIVARADWAGRTVDDYSRLFVDFLIALADAADQSIPEDLGRIMGTPIGALVGHLAQRALGDYELPIPRPRPGEIVILPENLASFGEEWGAPFGIVGRVAVVVDAVHRLVLEQAHVRDHIDVRLSTYARNFRLDPALLMEAIGLRAGGDPEEFMRRMNTPAQARAAAELTAIGSVLSAQAERAAVADAEDPARLLEALARRRATLPWRDRLVEFWFGIELGQTSHARAAALVAALEDACGDDALGRVWNSAATLPLPEDLDDPARLIARLSAQA